jgi:hypothetical protein
VAALAIFETLIAGFCFLVVETAGSERRRQMRFSLQTATIAILFCVPAQAQERLSPQVLENLPPQVQEKIEIGQGVICDTAQQVERYVALRGNGTETNVALRTVNNRAHVAACSVALVMFSGCERVAGLTVQGRLLTVVQINLHAFVNGAGWMKIPATVRYTVTAEKGPIV